MGLKITRISLLVLIALACCASIRASSQRDQEQRVRLPRRLSSRHNELASTESAKNTPQLLSSNHPRTETSAPSTSTDSLLDDGLLLSSAGAGKERKNPSSPASSSTSDDDDKKTLSQQVKEGKYGLIQDEIYGKKPKRPGVISYSANPEVPADTADNFGGLDEEEIWLAENHVLVLKGGKLPETDGVPETGERWPPIDDYKAPRRQVKIPPRPRVPPPFPVQLLEGGPIQLIGTNGSSLAENGTIDFEALPGGFKGFLPGEGPYFPFPSSPPANSSRGPEKKLKAEAVPGPFYPALPPGAVIVPPPSNQTDYDDEDQSIYYPPPYSFVYPRDNSTDIPPGPLVPGIILPPPPDFFSPLDEPRSTTKDKPAKRPSTTPAPSSTRASSYLPPRKSSTKLYKTHSVTSSPLGHKTAAYSPKPFSRAKLKNATFSRYQTEKTTSRTYSTTPFVQVTTPAPAKTTTLESPIQQFHIEQLLADERIESSTERSPWRVNSEPVPLLTFYASSSPSSVDQPVETTPSAITNVLTTENPTRYPGQASYYFYEEANSDEQAPSSTPGPVVSFLDATPQDNKKDYYDVEVVPSQQTAKDYNVKLIDSLPTEPPPPSSVYRYIDSGATSSQDKYEAQPVRNQSPRMLHSEPLYYRAQPTRSPPPKLSYFESPRPKNYDSLEIPTRQSNKPKPIYQYSFEANNYSKRAGKTLTRAPEIPPPPPPPPPRRPTLHRPTELPPLYPEYQDVQTLSGQYDYENSDVSSELVAERKIPAYVSSKRERTYYQPQPTTASPIRDTTLAGHQQYFTKQDEQLLDDVTKEYFTVFGKKLPSTTPIYGKSSVTERPGDYQSIPRQQQATDYQSIPRQQQTSDYQSIPRQQPASDYQSHPRQQQASDYQPHPRQHQPSGFRAQNIKVHYGDHTPGPFSLKDDILVNYKRPLPPINPDSEFISVVNGQVQPVARPEYRPRPSALQLDGRLRDFAALPARQRFEQRIEHAPLRHRPVSLAGDIDVNYKNPRPPLDSDAEFIGPSRLTESRGDAAAPDKPNAYFAYRLPGDGGHFYFLTPQAIGRQEATGSYLYSRPRGSGLLRRRRAREGD